VAVAENAAKLRDALAPFIYVDRKAGGRSPSSTPHRDASPSSPDAAGPCRSRQLLATDLR
jgi:hypothetical protein